MFRLASAVALLAVADAKLHPQWRVTNSKVLDAATGETSVTYLSQGFPLAPGEVANSDSWETVIEMPEGDIQITGLQAEIVYEDLSPVSLTDSYLHHWIFFQSGRSDPEDDQVGYSAPVYTSTPCLGYSFGVGAESRNSPVQFGNGYFAQGYAGTVWTANIHMLDTRGVATGKLTNSGFDEGIKNCIECRCGLHEYGGIGCCPDGSFCSSDSSEDAVEYFLSYTLTYRAGAGDLSKAITPMVLDVTTCATEYNIPKGSGTQTDTRSWPVMKAGDVVFAANHQHIGANFMNVTVTRKDTGVEDLLCYAEPTYGTDGTTPGNEDGYVVAIPPCYLSDEPVHLNVGDVVNIESQYDNADWHGGVMGLFYMGVAQDARQTFEVLLSEGETKTSSH